MGFSQYPNSIDNHTTIPVTIDLLTAVKAEIINRLRDSIIATQGELGTQPSGVYGTVRDRLDALTALINSSNGDGSGEEVDLSEILSRLDALEAATDGGADTFIPLAINAQVATNVYTAIGGDEFNPSLFPEENRTIVFVARISTSNPDIQTNIRLYNVTDGMVVSGTEFNSISISVERNEVILTVPAQLPNSLKTYEVQMKQAASSPFEPVFCQKAELQVLFG